MIQFKEVPEGLVVELTDLKLLLQEYPDLEVGLFEVMEYSDFAPESTTAEDWGDISGAMGHAAIGYLIYDDGALCYDYHAPYRMFEHPQIKPDDIVKELVKHGKLLFTPFEFSYHKPTEK